MAGLYQSGEYLARNPTWHTEDSPWKARHVASLLQRHGLKPQRVAEVGCGAGEVLVQLRSTLPQGVDFVGYDVSPQAIELCRPKEAPGLSFRLGDLTREASETFDLVLVMDVVEHVDDCHGFLRGIAKRAPWALIHVPLELTALRVLRGSPLMATRRAFGHLHYFTRDTLHATLDESGHRVVDETYTDLAKAPGAIRSLPRRLWALLRSGAFTLAPHLTVRALGGYSLLVLTRTDAAEGSRG